MTQTITQGRYTANINTNSGGFIVIVTRDGDCLHGMPAKFYVDARRALTGARRLLVKAAA